MGHHNKTINVQTGQVKAGSGNIVLKSNGIGSCVVVAALDTKENIGGMAHIMLPGKAPARISAGKTKYAAEAIDELISLMRGLGSCNTTHLRVCLAGGANVLMRDGETIGKNNIASTTRILKDMALPVVQTSLGGYMSRAVTINITASTIECAICNGQKLTMFCGKSLESELCIQ